MTELLKTIMGRKSVRSFDGRPVSAEDRERLEQYIRSIRNPFDIPVRFVPLKICERLPLPQANPIRLHFVIFRCRVLTRQYVYDKICLYKTGRKEEPWKTIIARQ